jgi:hypothetical protein
MDFKSLVQKITSMDDPIETVAAPELPKAIQLNEDAELRVLAGTSTILAEAKKKEDSEKKEESVKEEMEVGDSKKTASGGTVTKTATGIIHKGKKYGGEEEKSDDDEDAPKAKKAKKESIDAEEFKGKFAKMVESKKEETAAEKAADKAKKDEKKKKIAKIVDEGSKPDFLDVDGDGDKKEPMKKAAKEKGGDKKDSKKGMSAKQAKYFGKKDESVKSDKKVVAESVEPQLTFKDMVKLVQESGGQQRIDAKDEALFSWAQRVAAAKFTESTKQEVYAGLVYERMGGVFEMYDVLAEDQK